MHKSMTKIKRKIQYSDKKVFLIVSGLFAVFFCFASMGGDDIAGMHVESGSLVDYWERSIELYGVWSSRVLVNFILFIFTDHATILWALYMGICMYTLLIALSKIFVIDNHKNCNLFISCMVMLYPFRDLSSAGWIATTATYFGPTAFGIMSLVPIKKIYFNEKFDWWEYILYTIGLIYGANNEQVMLIIFLSYFLSSLYFMVQKKMNLYCGLMMLLSVVSCGVVMLCPGNQMRKVSEVGWFPTYGMLTLVDKIDIGAFTTLKWLFFDNNIFVICICILMMILVWKRYSDGLFRTIAAIPVVITVLCGPLKEITILLFPELKNLTDDIPYYGLITTNTVVMDRYNTFGKYMIMGGLVIILCVEIFLLLHNYFELIVAMILLGGGMATRIAIGFSPTIYGSGLRTHEVMSFCIIAVSILIYTRNVNQLVSEKELEKTNVIFKIGLALAFLDLWFVIASVY